MAAAEMCIDLGDLVGARRHLEGLEGDQPRLLRAKLARWEKDWATADKDLSLIRDPALEGDVRVERAHALLAIRELAGAHGLLQGFPKEGKRSSEARYLEGLALYHLGNKKAAIKVWRALIREAPQDAWVYKADWAYTNAVAGKQVEFSSWGKRVSILKRIGYSGDLNADLKEWPEWQSLPRRARI